MMHEPRHTQMSLETQMEISKLRARVIRNENRLRAAGLAFLLVGISMVLGVWSPSREPTASPPTEPARTLNERGGRLLR